MLVMLLFQVVRPAPPERSTTLLLAFWLGRVLRLWAARLASESTLHRVRWMQVALSLLVAPFMRLFIPTHPTFVRVFSTALVAFTLAP
jgi:hypothetical protein